MVHFNSFGTFQFLMFAKKGGEGLKIYIQQYRVYIFKRLSTKNSQSISVNYVFVNKIYKTLNQKYVCEQYNFRKIKTIKVVRFLKSV